MNRDLKDIIEAPRLTLRRYEDMTLPELLRMRDRVLEQKKDITSDLGPYSFKLVMSRLQQLIYHHRTHGNRREYNKEVTN